MCFCVLSLVLLRIILSSPEGLSAALHVFLPQAPGCVVWGWHFRAGSDLLPCPEPSFPGESECTSVCPSGSIADLHFPVQDRRLLKTSPPALVDEGLLIVTPALCVDVPCPLSSSPTWALSPHCLGFAFSFAFSGVYNIVVMFWRHRLWREAGLGELVTWPVASPVAVWPHSGFSPHTQQHL